MIVAFFGHAQYHKTNEHEHIILKILEQNIGNASADLYFGNYGAFDNFAYYCGKKYKATHPNVSLIFVTPYPIKKKPSQQYDTIIYPELENKPAKFAIFYRNRYMVEKADLVIAYIEREWGGAYQSYKYAKSKRKPIYILAESNV